MSQPKTLKDFFAAPKPVRRPTDRKESVASSFNDEVALATSGIDARPQPIRPPSHEAGAALFAELQQLDAAVERDDYFDGDEWDVDGLRQDLQNARQAPGTRAGARAGTRAGTRARAGARARAGTRGDLGGDARRLVQAVRRPGGAANSRGGVRARRRDGRRHGARHDVRSDAAGRPAAAARETQPDAHAAGAPRRAAG